MGTSDLPKPLCKLSTGESILQRQLEALALYFSLDDLLIVVGHKKEMIMEAFPELTFIYNRDFYSENTAKSLLKAIRKIDDDLLWLNGDVVFFANLLTAFQGAQRNMMLVNESAVDAEGVKYRCDLKGRISEISKNVQNPSGEALGINFVTAKSLPLLKKQLASCSPSDYFEKGIQMAIQQGMEIWPEFTVESACCEIDTATDLDKANKLISQWQKPPTS